MVTHNQHLPDDAPSDGFVDRETPCPLDRYLSRRIQSWIEQRYCAKIDAHGRLEQLLHDPTFITNPHGHSSLFADHGVIHARDVARQILEVLDRAHGLLIPTRDQARLEFMKGYGVQLAFIHDIALSDLSPFGRKMHAYVVTQIALSSEFDALIQAIWDENAGNVPERLANLPALDQDPRLVLREMLALAICHSKSAIPVELLSDPRRLRYALQRCALIDLHHLFDQISGLRSKQKPLAEKRRTAFILGKEDINTRICPERAEQLRQYYADFESEGFRWLVSEHPSIRQLTDDVLDTLRAIRCADALRQRGTTLKTSGNYEIFVDRSTGNAIFALRHTDQKLLLVEIPNPISAGEANLASSELTQEGDLRASFHRGAFADTETVRRAASNAALVLEDIQRDVIESFQRTAPSQGQQKDWQEDFHEMQILLESVDDNPDFALLVQSHLQQSHPTIRNTVHVVPSLKDVSERERRLYLEGKSLEWDDEVRRKALDRIAESGHKTSPIDAVLGFKHVKQIEIRAGHVLIDAGAQPGFVYIPLTGNLKIIPLGDYPTFLIQPWMPLGVTGVIRGSVRNATVVAEEDASLLMIPQDIYLNHWHQTYNLDEFLEWMQCEIASQNPLTGSEESLANSHQGISQDELRRVKQ